VTIADRQAEEAMRQLIKSAVPQHSVFGEEHGLELGSAAAGSSSSSSGSKEDTWLWVLDPIDGTKSFITGVSHPEDVCVAS
jgi:fructose-1,6-bisphosphatase/inositol monophosphatase family enzyme